MNNKPFLIIGHGSGNIINTDAIKNVLFIDIDDEEKPDDRTDELLLGQLQGQQVDGQDGAGNVGDHGAEAGQQADGAAQ